MSSKLHRTISGHSWNGEPIVIPPKVYPNFRSGSKQSIVDVPELSTPVTELDRISFHAVGIPLTASSTLTAKDTAAEHARGKYRAVLAAIFWCFFTLGLNDGSIGPLLPIYQEFYNVCRFDEYRARHLYLPDQLYYRLHDLYKQLFGMFLFELIENHLLTFEFRGA